MKQLDTKRIQEIEFSARKVIAENPGTSQDSAAKAMLFLCDSIQILLAHKSTQMEQVYTLRAELDESQAVVETHAAEITRCYAERNKLKAEVVNREGEKQEMREVIDRLKAEVERLKELFMVRISVCSKHETFGHCFNCGFDSLKAERDQLKAEVENLTAERWHYKAGWDGCKSDLDREREANVKLREALEKYRDAEWNPCRPVSPGHIQWWMYSASEDCPSDIAIQALLAAKQDETK